MLSAVCTQAWYFPPDLNDVLDERLVRGHLGLLHDGDGRADPGHQNELGALAQLVASLQEEVNLII